MRRVLLVRHRQEADAGGREQVERVHVGRADDAEDMRHALRGQGLDEGLAEADIRVNRSGPPLLLPALAGFIAREATASEPRRSARLRLVEHEHILWREGHDGRRSPLREAGGLFEDLQRDRILLQTTTIRTTERGNHLLVRAGEAIANRVTVSAFEHRGSERSATVHGWARRGVRNAACGDDRLARRRIPAQRRRRAPAGSTLSVPTKEATKRRLGVVVDLEGRADLLDPPVVHDHDAVGKRKRFFLVVGHVDGGDAQLALDAREFRCAADANLGVEGRSGSSSSRSCGWMARARASATRCCWPPES